MLATLVLTLTLGAGREIHLRTAPITNTPTSSGAYYVYFLNERDYVWEGMSYSEASKILPKHGSFMLSGPTLNGTFTYSAIRLSIGFVNGEIDSIRRW